ncbi:hypothetical protein EAG_09352 [Camponotus floridanus]|uniref:Uncharacterized protein n=1 Tax=Camponotus floridanus TaxID=104421 RepID=E2B0P1_CAMFO|nr:hypothetical protein EAG_09352 [Camponotus floridanus]
MKKEGENKEEEWRRKGEDEDGGGASILLGTNDAVVGKLIKENARREIPLYVSLLVRTAGIQTRENKSERTSKEQKHSRLECVASRRLVYEFNIMNTCWKDKIGNVENTNHKGQGNAFEEFEILLGENHNLQSSFVIGAVLNKREHCGLLQNCSELSKLFEKYTRTEKNHSAGEDTVGTHRTLRNMDKAIEPRSVSFQFPGAPSSMGSNPPRISLSLFLPTTFDDIPIYSQLLAGTLYDQIPSRKTLFPLYPISSPSMERLNGEKDEGRKARKERSGRACVPDFWSRSMIFPKRTNEGRGLRMAAMELDLAGGEWRIGSHRVGRCGCVLSSLILQPAFPRIQNDTAVNNGEIEKAHCSKQHSRIQLHNLFGITNSLMDLHNTFRQSNGSESRYGCRVMGPHVAAGSAAEETCASAAHKWVLTLK